MRLPIALLLLAATLGGCADPPRSPLASADPASIVPVWCYRTLADAECYLQPVPNRDTGFLGSFAFAGP